MRWPLPDSDQEGRPERTGSVTVGSPAYRRGNKVAGAFRSRIRAFRISPGGGHRIGSRDGAARCFALRPIDDDSLLSRHQPQPCHRHRAARGPDRRLEEICTTADAERPPGTPSTMSLWENWSLAAAFGCHKDHFSGGGILKKVPIDALVLTDRANFRTVGKREVIRS